MFAPSILIVAVFLVSGGTAVDVPLCDLSLCSCFPPNGAGENRLLPASATYPKGCICVCGLEEGDACTSDDACSKGTFCAFAAGQLKQTVCTSKCAKTACPQFQSCQIVNYQPVCSCMYYDCSANIQSPIQAIFGNTKKTFSNRCEMANANCDLLNDNPTSAVWRFS